MANPTDIRADYVRWKTLAPWRFRARLVWPSLSCRWGAVLERNEFKHKQRLYLSEQTDGSAQYPNTLVVTNVDVVKRRVAAAEHLAFEEESRSPFVKSWKKIIHPGEVNKIREFEARPSLLVTHTDAPELFVWDTETQPHRKTIASAADSEADRERAPSTPDLALVGHEENAEFALAVRRDAFEVASGGRLRCCTERGPRRWAVWRSETKSNASETKVARRARRRASDGRADARAADQVQGHTDGGGCGVPPRSSGGAVLAACDKR